MHCEGHPGICCTVVYIITCVINARTEMVIHFSFFTYRIFRCERYLGPELLICLTDSLKCVHCEDDGIYRAPLVSLWSVILVSAHCFGLVFILSFFVVFGTSKLANL